MYPCDFHLEAAKARQIAILTQCLEPQYAPDSDAAEQIARRRFMRAYQIRWVLFRLAPRLAARLVL